MSALAALIYDKFMQGTEKACLTQWRHDLLRGVSGRILEIGAGTGTSLPLYPRGGISLVMAEPDRKMPTNEMAAYG
jgi:hypothetical protein